MSQAPAAPAEPTWRKLRFRNIDWHTGGGIGILHVGCLFAPFTFTWSGLGLAGFLWWLCGGLGICVCFHRLLTHRSFKTPKIVEYFLTILGTMNWQGSPIKWVGVHRLHHQHSDDEEDPHSPKHGFNWAHVLWCVVKAPSGPSRRDAAKDLQRDPVMRIIDRWHFVPLILLAVGVYFLGEFLFQAGWSWVVWGVCVRTVFTYHATWFVNSAGHTWGYRNFETGDGSKNIWWVSLLSFGEGWHNNHHASQRSARHGMRWWEFDMTYLTIRLMKLVGLARDIIEPTGKHTPVG